MVRTIRMLSTLAVLAAIGTLPGGTLHAAASPSTDYEIRKLGSTWQAPNEAQG